MKKNLIQICVLGAVLIGFHSDAQPVITSQPGNPVVVWGGNATFSVMATGVGPLTYQWQLNGTNLPNNIITTVAGGNLFNNLPATNTILNSAAGGGKDSFGNIFIADTYNNVIRKVDTNGLATIVAGNGSAGYSGDGGVATNAEFLTPVAVIVDPIGNLLIADSGNNRIRKVGTNGIITTVAGNGIAGNSGNNGAATSAQIYNPSGLCLDAAGNLFIADTYNFVIRKVTNGIITTVAGLNSSGPGYDSDGLQATVSRLNYPMSVAVDASNNWYIADSQNNRVRKVKPNGVISTLAGNGTTNYTGDGGVATSAALNLPVGVAVDAARNVFIVDSGNHCIRKVGTNGVITTVAGNGTMGFFGDGGIATNANLTSPLNVTVDTVGNLLIADTGNNRIRQVGTNGIITTIAGRNLNDGDFATNATLSSVSGVSFDAAGNLFVADTRNNRIRKVDTNGIITTVAGNGFLGYSGDGVYATNTSLNLPSGVTLDANGNLYIADTVNSRIRKVNTNGIIATVVGNGSLGSAGNGGAATNAQIGYSYTVMADVVGNLFIAEGFLTTSGAIRKVDTNGIITSANTYSGGSYGVASDLTGNLYVSYSSACVIRKTSTNAVKTTVTGSLGSFGFSGDGGPATSAKVSIPKGLAVDATGNLYFSDSGNNRIRKINTNNIITTIAGNGTNGYSGDGRSANNSSLSNPFGLVLDTGGNVYFADSGNNRIRKLAYVNYADQLSFTITNITPDSLSNHYSVIITSASGSVTSSVVMVNLLLPPITPVFTASNSVCTFSWSAVSNQIYQLQSTTNLIAPNWIDFGIPITATNNSVSATDAVVADGQRFYRVRLWP